MLSIVTTAIVVLQLASDVQAHNSSTRTCEAQFEKRGVLAVKKVQLCSSTRNRARPVFVCGGQGTTVTLDGARVTFRAPNIDSYILIQCGDREIYQFCPVGKSDYNRIDACQHDMAVWTVEKKV